MSSGLVELAPEMMHKVALSGDLSFDDVKALSQTCRRMRTIFVDDDYGRDIHHALKGVVENVKEKRWRSARLAVRRRWFREEDGEEESVWREVAKVVVEYKTEREEVELEKMLENEEDLEGWENVMLAALALPGASGWMEEWEVVQWLRKKTFLLHVAARVGSERVVDWLLARGADLDLKSEGETPLYAACEGGRLAMVRKLVEGGADVTACRRRTVLSAASRGGYADVVAYLLGLGVLDVFSEFVGTDSSLYAACEEGHTEVARLLIEGGANVDVVGINSRGPLFLACLAGNVEMVQVLMDAGTWSGVDKRGSEWGNPWGNALGEAAERGYVDVVRVLLDGGVAGDVIDEDGDTPLCLADGIDVIRLLVTEGGADVNKPSGTHGGSKFGYRCVTPLMQASWRGDVEVVRFLLDAGAAVGPTDTKNRTALDLARESGRDEVVHILESWCGILGGR